MRTAHAPSALTGRPSSRGIVRTLRNVTGLVLAVYIATHFFNHALGVISIDAQDRVLEVLAPVWQSVPGTLLLYGSLILHALLGLYALWLRKTLRMPTWELAQLVFGLAVPLLLMPHVFGTRVAQALVGTTPTYHSVVASIWASPVAMVRQPLLVVVVWIHLLIGLHYWLRLRSRYRHALRVFYPVAVVVPLLALLGFWGAGIELRELAAIGDETAVQGYGPSASALPLSPEDEARARARLDSRERKAYEIYAGLLVIVLLARAARHLVHARGETFAIRHSNGRLITAPAGHSLLEALRDAGIPHASVCGGRARCTTCRVRVEHSAGPLPPPEPLEADALRRISAGNDVRLACQLRPTTNVRITPLVPPNVGPADLDARRLPGRERAVAVMFVDLRESSRLGEQRMPYDVFFILNRFFAELAEALRETGGYYSTFNGDGLMALYGTETDLPQGCRDAIRGAIAIAARLAQMNAAFAHDLGQPLRAGIGIHAGDAIVGTMGPPATPLLSALGDTVNVASRLEAETKRRRCMLVVSSACARAAALDLSGFPEHTVTVRGRSEPVTYHAIADPATLTALLAAADRAAPAADRPRIARISR